MGKKKLEEKDFKAIDKEDKEALKDLEMVKAALKLAAAAESKLSKATAEIKLMPE
jgi:hypothetical protein